MGLEDGRNEDRSRSDNEATGAVNPAKQMKPRLWSGVFVAVVLMTLASFMVGQGSNTGTSVYLVEVGSTSAYAGVLAAVFSAAAAIARIVCGPVIDTKGRSIVMIVGSVVMLLGTLGPLLCNDLGLFILWRFLQGVGFSAATTASATAAADVLPVERLGEGISYYSLGQALAMSIGPALALFLVTTDPPDNLFWGLVGCSLAALLFALLCRYERNPLSLPKTSAYRFRWEEEHGILEGHPEKDEKDGDEALEADFDGSERNALIRFLDNTFEKRALPGTIPMLVLVPAFGFVIFYVGLYGTTLGIGNPGLFYTISAVVMVLVRLRSGAFMDRVPAIRILAIAIAGGLIAFGLLFAVSFMPQGTNEAAFYLSGVFYGVCIGLGLPTNQSVAVKNSPPDRWGKTNALFLFAVDVGAGAASFLWGITNDVFGFPVTIACVMVCLVVTLVVARICYPPSDRRWSPERS